MFAAAFALAWWPHHRALVGQLLSAVLAGLAPVAAAWLLRTILNDLAVSGEHRPHTAVLVALAYVLRRHLRPAFFPAGTRICGRAVMTELVIAVLAMGACVYGASSAGKLARRQEYRAFRDAIAQTALTGGHPRAVRFDDMAELFAPVRQETVR